MPLHARGQMTAKLPIISTSKVAGGQVKQTYKMPIDDIDEVYPQSWFDHHVRSTIRVKELIQLDTGLYP